MNITPKKELMRKLQESFAINEAEMTAGYEDVMKAFFDSTVDREVSDKIISRVRTELGKSYVDLIFSNKDNPAELVKLVSNAVKAISGEPFNLENPEEVDVPSETDVDVSSEVTPDASQNNNSDVGISVSTSNEV